LSDETEIKKGQKYLPHFKHCVSGTWVRIDASNRFCVFCVSTCLENSMCQSSNSLQCVRWEWS